MNLKLLHATDSQLVQLRLDKSTKRSATKEIHRRKAVGAWRLMANWSVIKEPIVEESLGIRRAK